jgi:hypothetical protein
LWTDGKMKLAKIQVPTYIRPNVNELGVETMITIRTKPVYSKPAEPELM